MLIFLISPAFSKTLKVFSYGKMNLLVLLYFAISFVLLLLANTFPNSIRGLASDHETHPINFFVLFHQNHPQKLWLDCCALDFPLQNAVKMGSDFDCFCLTKLVMQVHRNM